MFVGRLLLKPLCQRLSESAGAVQPEPRRGEVHYEIGNGWAGWFVIETIQDPKRKQVQCYYHPLHYLQEGRFEEGQTVFFVNKCDAPKGCEFVWITGLC